MDTGLVVIHFGEPPTPELAVVERYLTRIFLQNADLEAADSPEAARERAEELARRRAPGLIEEYEAIGGSPLNAQAEEQARALDRTLDERGYDVTVRVAFQFIEPTIEDVLGELRQAGIDRLLALPVYPLCGPSTTVAALERVDDTIAEMDWEPEVAQVSGWHRHPAYLRMRAENVREEARIAGIDQETDDWTLLFSAHGTPTSYIDEGSRYVDYVEETAEAVASLAGFDEYALGYQNHTNRDIPWTEPDVEDLIGEIETGGILVEPMSFMHEQSETLAELDEDLAADAAALGLEFHRVPVPHDSEEFPGVLADVVEPTLAGVDPTMFQLRPCRCKPVGNTYCLNAPER